MNGFNEDFKNYMTECAKHISNPQWLVDHCEDGYALDLTPDQMKASFLGNITPQQFADSKESLKARSRAEKATIDARVERMRTDWNIR